MLLNKTKKEENIERKGFLTPTIIEPPKFKEEAAIVDEPTKSQIKKKVVQPPVKVFRKEQVIGIETTPIKIFKKKQVIGVQRKVQSPKQTVKKEEVIEVKTNDEMLKNRNKCIPTTTSGVPSPAPAPLPNKCACRSKVNNCQAIPVRVDTAEDLKKKDVIRKYEELKKKLEARQAERRENKEEKCEEEKPVRRGKDFIPVKLSDLAKQDREREEAEAARKKEENKTKAEVVGLPSK